VRQTGYGLAILLMAAIMAGCCDRDSKDSRNVAMEQDIVGAWRSTVQFTSGPFAAVNDLEFMYLFNAGGTMIESSNYDAAPPVPPAYGVWRSLDSNRFELRYEFYMTQVPDSSKNLSIESGWLPAGRGLFVDTVTLSSDGKSFVSKAHFSPLDQSGKAIEGGGVASMKGERIGF